MADRHLLLIDTDETFHDELQRILAPYGVTVDVVNDGSDGLGRAASIGPELLIIAVDLPDKVGYGICNKAKKGVAKHIPVMLATASITPADLEQHRRLKVHADEYVDKRTITEDDLLAKIDALVNLGPPMEDVPIEDLGVEHEEIAFEDSDDFVSEATSVSAGVDGLNLGIDPGIDAETDAVFAGLVEGPGVGDEERTVPPKARTPDAPQFLSTPPPTSPPVSATLGAARLGVRAMNANGSTSGAIAAVAPPAPLPPAPAPSFARAPAPATVPPSSSSSSPGNGSGDGTLDVVDEPAGESDHEIHERHQAQVADLEAQVTKLRVQLDEVRRASPTPATPAPSSFSREREFLNLREVINRKEKDLLDLKDELDGRDRLILGGKEKIREQERKLRDADEKLLHFEQELVNAREALAALRDDKEKALEREKGLKARIEMAQAQAKKTDDEIEALRKKGLADLQALRDENNARRQDAEREKKELAGQITGLQAQVAAAIRQGENERQSLQKSLTQQLTGEREAAVAAVRAELGELLDRKGKEHLAELTAVRDENRQVVTKMQGEHAAALARSDKDHHAALVKANEEKAAAVTMAEERRKRELIDNDEMWRAEAKAAERRREKELGARDEEHKRALGDINALHAAKLEKLDKDHKDGLQAARDQAARDQAAVAERHRQELATADQRRQRELTSAADEHGRTLAAALAKHGEQIAATALTHDQALARLGKEHDEAKKMLVDGHQAKVATLDGEAARLTKSVAAAEDRGKKLDAELAEAGRISAERAEKLSARESDLIQRSEQLATLQGEHETLIHEHGEVQEQLMKAYQKLRAEEAAVTKAKKALALALTVLDAEAGGMGEKI